MDEPLADEERLKNYTQEEKPSKKQLEDETRNVCAFYLHLKTSHFELPVVQSLPILPGKKHLFSLKKNNNKRFISTVFLWLGVHEETAAKKF